MSNLATNLAHEICGVDFYLSYNKCNPIVNELIENFKKFLTNYQISYYSNDDINFSEDYIHNLRIQSIRSKIFVYFIDRFALESNWFIYTFIYAKMHHEQYGTPLMLPVIIDHESESYLLNEELTNKLTNECSTILRMSQIQSFENFLKKIKSATSSIINASFYENPMVRIVDNMRPVNSKENDFIEKILFKEHELMKEYSFNTVNIEAILPKEKVFLAVSVPYNELKEHLISMIHANCSLIWLDVTSICKMNYFSFIWKKANYNDGIKIYKKESIKNYFKTPNILIFYDLNTSELMEVYYKYSFKHKWNLELCDSYVKFQNDNFKNRNSKLNEIFYICQFKATLDVFLNDKNNTELDINLNKLQPSIIERKFLDYYKDATKYNYKKLYGPINVHPLILNIDNDKNKQFFYSALYKPIEKETNFLIRYNVHDNELMKIFHEHTINNFKLIYIKAFKNENQISNFTLIFTNTPIYEGTCQLFIGLSKNELSNKISSMREKNLFPLMITNYGVTTNNEDHLFAVFFCQF